MAKAVRYRAPALEKGIAILELIARESVPLSLSDISRRLLRSKGEIFRIVMALESMGYIARAGNGDGYTITNRLFLLGMAQPPVRTLLDCALPQMQEVAARLWQSCHLVVDAEDEIVVIARVDSPGDVGYSVRIGHRRPIEHSASGAVFFAFQPDDVQAAWLKRLKKKPGFDQRAFIARVKQVRRDGYAHSPSARVKAILDLSVPLFEDGRVVATIVVPYVDQRAPVAPVEVAVEELRRAAHSISAALALGSSSVIRPGMTYPSSETARSPRRRN